MAYIKLKDYLESLTAKGSTSSGDLLPLLDSDASNAIKTVTKGTLVSLENIAGFTAFSQSVENQLANTSQFSESLDDTFAKDSEVATTASLINSSITSVSTNLSNYETENNSVVQAIQAYTSSLKGAITVSGDDVSIKGTLTTNNFFAQYVTSSILITTGSNKFGDNVVDKHEFTGSVHFDDTIYLDGEPIGITALNAFSSSVNNSIVQIGNHTSSVDNSVTLFGVHTASQTTINSGISAVTGAFATELGEIQNTLTGHRNELNGIEAWTASLDDTYATDAQLYRLYQATRSLELHSGSVDNSITLFGAHTASQTTINSGISAVTGAFATELGEIQTQLTNRRGELNGLEAYTASLKSVELISSSAQIAVEISGSGFTSASGEFEELTLTRGDGTTAQVDLSPRKILELVKNKEPQTLVKGTPVFVSGSTGNASHVYAASASRADRMPAAYVLNQDLAFDAEGYGIVVGYINGVNTSTFNEGDNVYVGESGGYTNVKPTGNSNRIQKLGNVIAVDAVNGSGVITGAGRSNDVPNIQEGYMWVGNSSDVATQFTTSSVLGYGHDATFNTITASRLQLEDGTSNNILIGGTNGHILDPLSGVANIFIGDGAGDALTTGDGNIGIGASALSNISDESSDGNVAIGLSAGNSLDSGSYNVMIGQSAMYFADNSDYAVAVGYEALRNSDDDYAIGIGYRAGYRGGQSTVFIGELAGYRVNGAGNTGVGSRALGGQAAADGGGTNNAAFGGSALRLLQNGADNVAVGSAAGYALTQGDSNIIIGRVAGYELSTGNLNTIIGRWAGYSGAGAGASITTGNGNTLLGAHSQTQNSDDYNSIVIGSGSIGNGSNTVVIGNDDVTDTYLKGNVSGSSFHISETATLVSQNPLPTGVAGMLAVSASASNEKLYFYDGSSWREVSLV